MNTACQLGSFLASVLFGYLVQYYRTYEAALLAIGAVLWLKVDPTRPLLPS